MLRFRVSFGILFFILLPCYVVGLACVPGLCQNGGSCYGDVFWYVCSCREGFNGRNCENTYTGPVDTAPPILVKCPFDIVETTTSQYGQTDWTDPTPYDASDTYLVYQSHIPYSFFAIGTTTVTYIFADDFGNIANCTFEVTFLLDEGVDNTPPTISSCPSNITLIPDPVTGNAVANWTPPSAVDDAGPAFLISQPPQPGSSFPASSNVRVDYTYSDLNLNFATCAFYIIVQEVGMADTTPPTLTHCPEDIHMVVPAGTPDVPVYWEEPMAEDDGGGPVTLTRQNAESGQTFSVNTQTSVLYEFTDSSGNVVQCSFKVMITEEDVTEEGDNTPPTILNCPSDLTLVPDPVTREAVANWAPPSAEDDAGPVFLISQPPQPGTSFPTGSNVRVAYTYSDLSRNYATCTFYIIVQEIEVVPLTLTCPDDIQVVLNGDQESANVTWDEPVAPSGEYQLASTRISGTLFPLGVTTVNYFVQGPAGDSAVCSFNVEVLGAPTLICPSDVLVMIDPDEEGAIVDWDEPVITEPGTFLIGSTVPGSPLPLGVTEITYQLYGTMGLEAECSFLVNVVRERDTTPPEVMDCPTEVVTVVVQPGVTSAVVTWNEPTAIDDSGHVTSKQTARPGEMFRTGTTSVHYQFEDENGNVANCTFDIKVEALVDSSPPSISNCPNDVEIYVLPDSLNPTVEWNVPSAVDDYSGVLSIRESHQPGDQFPRGESIVTYTFEDQSSNAASCSFQVVVMEIQRPTVSICPAPINIGVEIGLPGDDVNWVEPYVTTELTIENRHISHTPGSFFPLGETLVSYNFTFAQVEDFILSCNFTVNVFEVDQIPPEITYCPGNIHKLTNSPTDLPMIQWNDPTAEDNSGNVTIGFQSHVSGMPFPVKNTEVTYHFMDSSRNVADCRFIVTVEHVSATVVVPMTFRIDEEFSTPLTIKTSDAYRNLTGKLENEIVGVVMTRRQLRNNFGGINIVQLKPGSIVVEADVWFHTNPEVRDLTVFIENLFNSRLENDRFMEDLQITSVLVGTPVIAPTTTQLSVAASVMTTNFDDIYTDDSTDIITKIVPTGDQFGPNQPVAKPGRPDNTSSVTILITIVIAVVAASVLVSLVTLVMFSCRSCSQRMHKKNRRKEKKSRRRAEPHTLGAVSEIPVGPSDDSEDLGGVRFIRINQDFDIEGVGVEKRICSDNGSSDSESSITAVSMANVI